MTYTVTIKPSELKFSIEENENILDAALRNNIYLAHSCRNGDCGACETKILVGNLRSGSCDSRGSETILTCQSVVESDIEIEAEYYPELAEIKQKTVPVKVESLDLLSDSVLRLIFRTPPMNKLDYLPGQYIELTYQGITRPYSIANTKSSTGKIELHIRKVDNGMMSSKLFGGLQENTLMRLQGPSGTFFTRECDSPIIFLVTGTGYAPVKAMIEDLIIKRDHRELHIYWGGRKRTDFYCDQPIKWSEDYENIFYTPVLSRSSDSWTGQFGYIQHIALMSHQNINNFSIYACGSPAMITDAKKHFINAGLDSKHFYSDAFTAAKNK